jgi:hypothetical protein
VDTGQGRADEVLRNGCYTFGCPHCGSLARNVFKTVGAISESLAGLMPRVYEPALKAAVNDG